MVKPATELSVPVFLFGKFYARLSFHDGDNRARSLFLAHAMGTTVADTTCRRPHYDCYRRIKVEIAPKDATKGVEILGFHGSASGINARSGEFGSLERSKRERNCPGVGVDQRDFSLTHETNWEIAPQSR